MIMIFVLKQNILSTIIFLPIVCQDHMHLLLINYLWYLFLVMCRIDALVDPKWKKAMNDEMEALQKKHLHGILFLYLKEKRLWAAYGL